MGRAPPVSLSISSPTRAHLENLKRLLLQASRYCRHLDWLICSEPPPSRRHHPTIFPLSSRSYVAKTSTPAVTQRSPFQYSKETSSQSDNRKWRTFVGGGVHICWLRWKFAHTNSSVALNILKPTSDASWSIFTSTAVSTVAAWLLRLRPCCGSTRLDLLVRLGVFPRFFHQSRALILYQYWNLVCSAQTDRQSVLSLFF